jgi:hypothetical protein
VGETILKGSVMAEYEIIVWDCTFCKVDEDGNNLLNEDGTVKIFGAPKMDWSHIAEYVEDTDLEEN